VAPLLGWTDPAQHVAQRVGAAQDAGARLLRQSRVGRRQRSRRFHQLALCGRERPSPGRRPQINGQPDNAEFGRVLE
jgi:hypothetical protein